jgi:iron complex outermembrane recepter protein
MSLSTRCKVVFAHINAVACTILSSLHDLRAAAPLPGSSSVQQLKRLSLEELLKIDVMTVSRRNEPFGTTASAISVLTGDDVRRSGATTLADALRFSTGLEVARIDGRTWGIASRGFNINSSNKLQVMMDGRSLYTLLFSGVFWDVQDTELSDLDRIEVVRGPGATMWGANAVNGVISIQTKSAQDTQGTLVSAGVATRSDSSRLFATVSSWRKVCSPACM